MFNVKRQICHENRHMSHRVLCEFSRISKFNFDGNIRFDYSCITDEGGTKLFKALNAAVDLVLKCHYATR